MSENIKTNLSDSFAEIFSSAVTVEEVKEQDKPEAKLEAKGTKKEALPEKEKKDTGVTTEVASVDNTVDLKAEYESLQKRLDESRSWGHKKNVSYVNAKKKIGEFLSKLQEDEVISAEEVNQGLSFFDLSDDTQTEDKITETKENPYVTLKQNLDQEFSVFKKYAKLPNADEKYQSFFSFLPLFPPAEQEKMINYMTNEKTEVVIDNIMLLGAEIYDNLYIGAEKNGGVIPFVKSLHAEIKKLQDKNLELLEQLDVTEGKVYNRSINSKVSRLEPVKQINKADIWQNPI
jgi:hypothetical protein